MCNKCDDEKHSIIVEKKETQGRREFILKSAKAASLGSLALGTPLMGVAQSALASGSKAPASTRPKEIEAFGVTKKSGPFQSLKIKRRALTEHDVEIEILYAGICHSDIHTVNEDWGGNQYPVVPGHEIVGKVIAVGPEVKSHKVGDHVGVGCMVDSCAECVNCKNDREQNCLNGTTFTYGSKDKHTNGVTYGGYSRNVIVKDHFCVSIPDGVDLSRVAPIMCAGITTFSPMQHWELKEDQEIAVVGIGGLGHMAIKLAVAKGAKVTAFTTSQNKFDAIKKMGAKPVLSTDAQGMKKYAMKFDLMISTIPYPFQMQSFLGLLKLDATLVNVGQLTQIDGLSGMMMGFNRQKLAGSMIGGMKETQEVVNFCAKHDVLPDVELIKPSQIDEAYKRVVNKDIKFRFVIDMKS